MGAQGLPRSGVVEVAGERHERDLDGAKVAADGVAGTEGREGRDADYPPTSSPPPVGEAGGASSSDKPASSGPKATRTSGNAVVSVVLVTEQLRRTLRDATLRESSIRTKV